jgi:hypothetical protein
MTIRLRVSGGRIQEQIAAEPMGALNPHLFLRAVTESLATKLKKLLAFLKLFGAASAGSLANAIHVARWLVKVTNFPPRIPRAARPMLTCILLCSRASWQFQGASKGGNQKPVSSTGFAN